MKKLRSFVLVSIPTLLFGAVLVLACGEEETVTLEPGRDARADTSPVQPDGGGGTDADLDAGLKADVVTPQTVAEFALQVDNQLCGALTRCCFGNGSLAPDAAVDGGRYDRAECSRIYRNIGFEFSSTGVNLVDGGEALIDKTRAAECLAEIQLISCNLSGPDMTRIRAKCFESIVGTRTSGQPCEAAIECGKGLFCDQDGGVCAPLRGDGGPCSIYDTGDASAALELDSVRSEEACSWRGSGDTKLRCGSYDGGSAEYVPRSEWRCQPQVGLDQACNSTVWCKDSICDINQGYVCKSPVTIFTTYCPRVVAP
jgi:hypothetical protein